MRPTGEYALTNLIEQALLWDLQSVLGPHFGAPARTTETSCTGSYGALLEPRHPLVAMGESLDAASHNEIEPRFSQMFDAMGKGFCVIEMIFDEDGQPIDYRFLQTNQSFETQTGLKDAVGQTMRSLRPDHEHHWFQIYGSIARTGTPERFERQAAALQRWFEVYAFRIGAPEQFRVAIVFGDITERKSQEEITKLQARDSTHRAKNIFAVMSSLIRLTQAETVAEYRKTLLGRVNAFLNSYQLLENPSEQEITLGTIIKDGLLTYAMHDCVRMDGPEIVLSPSVARWLLIVVHELATNAVKYGALSIAGGLVSIKWAIRDEGRLEIVWSEMGGPQPKTQPREGVGSATIKQCVVEQMSGQVQFDWRSEGLVCSIGVPLKASSTELLH